MATPLDRQPQEADAPGRYRRLVDLAPDGIFTIGLDGRYTSLNPAWERLTGWSRGEWLGRAGSELVHPDDVPLVLDVLARGFRGEAAGPFRVRVRARSGEYRVAEVRTAPEVSDGAVTGIIGMGRDVTDELRAAAALRQSEERFARAFRANPSPMLITRLADGVILEANDAFLKAIEYPSEEVVGRATRDFVWAEPVKRQEMVHAMEVSGRVRGLEVKARTKSGKTLDWLLSLEVIRLEGEAHTIGAAVDITERKRVEEALRKSEEKFARAFRSSPNIVIITRMRDGVIVEVNDAWTAASGYSREEAVGRSTRDLLWTANEDRERLMDRLKTQGSVSGLEMQIRTKAGTLRDGLVAVEVMELEGEPHLLVVAKDVTEEKRVAGALRESEERFRRLVQELGVGVVVLDPEFRIQLCNPAAATLLGLSREELMGRGIHDLPFESVREDGSPFPTTEHPSSVARRTGKPVRHVVLGHRVRGAAEWSWHLVDAEPMTEANGALRQIVLTVHDITERRQAEVYLAELRESLRRTEMMSALGAVVGGVAHEVRNPLFAISATVDAFEARFGAEAQHARYVQALRREVARLSELMSALLDYGRPPSLELSDHALQEVIGRASEHCAPLAQQAGVRVVVEPGALQPRLPLDPTRMVQVFQNLIDNAIRHSPAGGVVTVAVAEGGDGGRGWVQVTVADQGRGFTEEDLPHVFEPFFSRRHGGTGLGLSIVQRIVEQHGGQVRAENRVEGGAAMMVRLPHS